MRDESKNYEIFESPAGGAVEITLSDATEHTNIRAFMCGTGGDLAAEFFDGSVVTLTGIEPGVVYPFRIVKFLSTGTSGVADIVAFY